MAIASRRAAGMHDVIRRLALAERWPAQSPHVADPPYRPCTDSARSAEHARVWESRSGELAALAIVQNASSGTLDHLIQPDAVGRGIADELLAWALARCREELTARQRPLSWWIEAGADQQDRSALAARHGCAPDDSHLVRLERSLDESLSRPRLPDEFTLRPLAGPARVEAYVALHRAAFGTEYMTSEWRRRTLEVPRHMPALDLVAVAPGGRLAGLCIGWPSHSGGRSVCTSEPLGVHPDVQRIGLGHALLAEALRRMREHAVAWALVETHTVLPDTPQLYASAGCRVTAAIARYSRDFPMPEERARRRVRPVD